MTLPSLQAQLASVQVGDIIYGTYPGASGGEGSAICLVLELTNDAIHTRAVTTQYEFVFDRRTGVAVHTDGTAHCQLDSIASLPADHHSAMLDIDRKYRLGLERSKRGDWVEGGGRLLRHEMDALIFGAEHWSANPLSREFDNPLQKS